MKVHYGFNYLLAQESSITQVLVNVIGISGGVVRFTGQLTDPFEYFLSVLLAVFAIDLWITRTKKKHVEMRQGCLL